MAHAIAADSLWGRYETQEPHTRCRKELEERMSDLLIKNGTVVDGTGAPAFAADVRVKNGTIAEIGQNLTPAG